MRVSAYCLGCGRVLILDVLQYVTTRLYYTRLSGVRGLSELSAESKEPAAGWEARRRESMQRIV